MDFLLRLEQSGLAIWIRESPSIWAYPTVLFLHTVGIGFLAGASAAIDLRILGFAPKLPLSSMEQFFKVMYFGFWINVVSGLVLLIADATKFLSNPVFYIKLIAIGLGVLTIQILKIRVFRRASTDYDSIPMNGKVLAAISLFLWVAAITAGRLTAYIGSIV
jgi:hypothetical protein